MEDPKVDLAQLAVEICQEVPGSPIRQRKLTILIKALSKKLWKENTPYYGDALQDTYAFLCRRLCDLYDPEKASLAVWLNNHLKWRLFALKQEAYKEEKKRIYMPASPEEGLDPIANIPAAAPPEYSIVDATRDWLVEDKTGELQSMHLKKNPEVNMQSISLRRLPPNETSWSDLSKEYGVPVPTLAAFYQRKCVPRLRKFIEEEGIDG